jgi:ABC-type transporter Mla subunit MlaD
MNTEEIVRLLTRLDRRLATVADQARETREQAQHTLDRLERLRQDLDRIRLTVAASADTSDQLPIFKDKPD